MVELSAVMGSGDGSPERERLEERLAGVLAELGEGRVQVLERRENRLTTTSPTEVLVCRTARGRELEVFCKHVPWQAADSGAPAVPLEAEVYGSVLARCPLPSPRFYGWWGAPERGRACLALEYLRDGRRPNHLHDPGRGMELAAAWIGAFHAFAPPELARLAARPDLRRFDPAHYARQVERLARVRPELFAGAGWLSELVPGLLETAEFLTAAVPTLLHGEYCPQNVLCAKDEVYPIDWETPAVGAGEIDLAMLIDRWPEEVAERCARAYVRARWDGVRPTDFESRLAAAGAHVNVHWLVHAGTPEPSGGGRAAKDVWRVDQLKHFAARLGLL